MIRVEINNSEFFQALQVNGHYELVQAVGDTNDAYRAAFNKAYFLRENSELLISTVARGTSYSFSAAKDAFTIGNPPK